jgi:putative transposase
MAILGYSERRACRLLEMNRWTYRRPTVPVKGAELRQRLCELAEARRRFGSPRLTVLLNREGWAVNHKRPSHLRAVLSGSTGPGQSRSLDFMSDVLLNGRRARLLTIADGWGRSCPHTSKWIIR